MQGRRDVESALGHRTSIEILPGGDGMRLTRSDASEADAVFLDRRASQILSAYLASVIAIGIAGRADEEVDDAYGTVLSAHDEPAPLVRIEQDGRRMDIPAHSWDVLRCEINLMVPRLREGPVQRTAH